MDISGLLQAERKMWQSETFDIVTIERELGWAADMGMNTARVFLHNFVWEQDPAGFKLRVDRFLVAAAKLGIKPMTNPYG